MLAEESFSAIRTGDIENCTKITINNDLIGLVKNISSG